MVLRQDGRGTRPLRKGCQLAIHREMGERRHEGAVLCNLGILYHERGRIEETLSCYAAALAIHGEVGDRFREGMTLGNLASMHLDQGRMDEARMDVEAALAIHREVGNRGGGGVFLAGFASRGDRGGWRSRRL